MIAHTCVVMVGALQLSAGLGFLAVGDFARAAVFVGCSAATFGTMFCR